MSLNAKMHKSFWRPSVFHFAKLTMKGLRQVGAFHSNHTIASDGTSDRVSRSHF